MPLKTVEIVYYAILKEQRGADRDRLETAAATPAELYAELASSHHFSLGQHQLQVAINDAFADWQSALQDGDQVVFLPPVSGG